MMADVQAMEAAVEASAKYIKSRYRIVRDMNDWSKNFAKIIAIFLCADKYLC